MKTKIDSKNFGEFSEQYHQWYDKFEKQDGFKEGVKVRYIGIDENHVCIKYPQYGGHPSDPRGILEVDAIYEVEYRILARSYQLVKLVGFQYGVEFSPSIFEVIDKNAEGNPLKVGGRVRYIGLKDEFLTFGNIYEVEGLLIHHHGYGYVSVKLVGIERIYERSMFERVAGEPKQMTLTVEDSNEISLFIAGTGIATIDWGNGSEIKTYTLPADDNWDNRRHDYWEKYTLKPDDNASLCGSTITITGENITHLDCYLNPISSLDVSRNDALTHLYCDNNDNLLSFVLGNNPALTHLSSKNNRMTNLDVSNNTALIELECSGNELIQLDVSKNTALALLDCSDNQLSSLDISMNTALKGLDCSYNELTSLDISKNSLLKKLDCNGNKMLAIEKKTSDVEVYMDRNVLEKRLKEIAKTKYRGDLAWGAMCYDPAVPYPVDYVCSLCGFTVKDEYDDHQVFEIREIEIIVKKIKNLGYDVLLDKKEYCPRCSNREIDRPELIFSIRYSASSNYHVARSNILNEYLCLLAFLEEKEKYTVERDEERSLHEGAGIIKKMTGLGDDLDLPYISEIDPFMEQFMAKHRKWKKLKREKKQKKS